MATYMKDEDGLLQEDIHLVITACLWQSLTSVTSSVGIPMPLLSELVRTSSPVVYREYVIYKP